MMTLATHSPLRGETSHAVLRHHAPAKCEREGLDAKANFRHGHQTELDSQTLGKIEIFSAGCATCRETIDLVKKLAGPEHEVHIHDMHEHEVAARAKQHGVRSLPAVVIDG